MTKNRFFHENSLRCNHLIITQRGWSEEYLFSVGLKNILERDGSTVRIIDLTSLDDSYNVIFPDICNYTINFENSEYVEDSLKSAELIWIVSNRKKEFYEIFKKFEEYFYANPYRHPNIGLPVKTVVFCSDRHMFFEKVFKVKIFSYIFDSIDSLQRYHTNISRMFLMANQVFWPFSTRIVSNKVYDRNLIVAPLFGNLLSKWRIGEVESLKYIDDRIPQYRKETGIKDLALVLLVQDGTLNKIAKILNFNQLKNTEIVKANTLSDIFKTYERSLIVLSLSCLSGFLQEEWLAINHHCFILYYRTPGKEAILAKYPYSLRISTEEISTLGGFSPKKDPPASIILDKLSYIIKNRLYEAHLSDKAMGRHFYDYVGGFESIWDYSLTRRKIFELKEKNEHTS
jgi:hypothetical protein